uniref:Uncharacterized protein n=1 Tax=Romanomermis culicivorax TaxID=13658 RepID=A0A915K622_ROMCU
MGKGGRNCQQAPTCEWSHTEGPVEYGKPQHRQDNWSFFIDDYNIKRVRSRRRFANWPL